MNLKLSALTAIAICAICSTVFAISFGGPGGEWPKTWPKELEPLRKQAWTWQHGDSMEMSYDIPFEKRDDFEAAWPHIVKLMDKEASLTLMRGEHLRTTPPKSAGVIIQGPRPNAKPSSVVAGIILVVDGEIVDLNRIHLPDTKVIDRRFEGEKK